MCFFYQTFYQAHIFLYDTGDLNNCFYKIPTEDESDVEIKHVLGDFAQALHSLADIIDPSVEDADQLKAEVIKMKEIYARRLIREKLDAFDTDNMQYNAEFLGKSSSAPKS